MNSEKITQPQFPAKTRYLIRHRFQHPSDPDGKLTTYCVASADAVSAESAIHIVAQLHRLRPAELMAEIDDGPIPAPVIDGPEMPTDPESPKPLPEADPQSDHWIMQIPVLSTSHVSEPDFDNIAWLDSMGHLTLVSRDIDMTIIWLLESWEGDAECNGTSNRQACGTIAAVIEYVREKGYSCFRLDRDGSVVAGLPVHDW